MHYIKSAIVNWWRGETCHFKLMIWFYASEQSLLTSEKVLPPAGPPQELNVILRFCCRIHFCQEIISCPSLKQVETINNYYLLE